DHVGHRRRQPAGATRRQSRRGRPDARRRGTRGVQSPLVQPAAAREAAGLSPPGNKRAVGRIMPARSRSPSRRWSVADESVRSVSEPRSPWVPIGLAVLGVLLLLAVCLGAVGLAVRQAVLFGKEVVRKVDESVAQAAKALEAVGVVVTFQDHL